MSRIPSMSQIKEQFQILLVGHFPDGDNDRKQIHICLCRKTKPALLAFELKSRKGQ